MYHSTSDNTPQLRRNFETRCTMHDARRTGQRLRRRHPILGLPSPPRPPHPTAAPETLGPLISCGEAREFTQRRSRLDLALIPDWYGTDSLQSQYDSKTLTRYFDISNSSALAFREG
ncbi:hypothetical protein N7G274_004379 [Stereocaulon virgatum]|uniref:Uncharacterized protein n=1 Tax=Stereocaulon virgatum TaxID=373712 RepID=A0ABR4AA22_9LECA